MNCILYICARGRVHVPYFFSSLNFVLCTKRKIAKERQKKREQNHVYMCVCARARTYTYIHTYIL